MIIIFLIFICLFLFGIKYIKNGFNDKYIDRNTTTIINGLFVIMVFFSHFKTYLFYIDIYDKIVIKILALFGQMMVSTFLFYSGFGIFESIKNKHDYMKCFFKKRFLPTYINFFIAVCLFFVLNIFMKIKYDYRTIILSFFGYESIGNSNWYMLVIFLLYIFTMLSFNFFKFDNKLLNIHLITFFTLIYIVIFNIIKDSYYVDTVLCYSAGMYYSFFRKKIDVKVQNNYLLSFLFFNLLFFVLYLLQYFTNHNVLIYNFCSIVFVIIIVLISMKFRFNNRFYLFIGGHTFWIYILQRLPMIMFQNIIGDNYIYFLVCFVITILLSIILNKITNKLYFNKNVL